MFVLGSLAKAVLPLVDNAKLVRPGVLFKLNKGSSQVKFVHSLFDTDICVSLQDNSDYLSKILKSKLISAVTKRLISDRPIGCLLSGGVDSSIIAYILCKLLGPKNVRTYSIGLEGGIDLMYARKMADFLGSDHTEVIFTPEQGLSVIPQVIHTLESYDVTTVRASIGMYLLSEYISKHTDDKVIFSGEGSDELFGGYLYFHNAPSEDDASNESVDLIADLYKYDVLRADRCISHHGLELRVPFLDYDVLMFSLALPSSYKVPQYGYEKFILRQAFMNDLPQEIIYRRKDGFSDAVSSMDKPWYTYIESHVNTRLGDELYDGNKYKSKEAMYYRLIFDRYFPKYKLNLPLWLPKWCGDVTNPSGRLVTL